MVDYKEGSVPHKSRNRFLREAGGNVVVSGGTSSGGSGESCQYAENAKKADVANRLANVHKLWGHEFDGTQDVSGTLNGVTELFNDRNIEVTPGGKFIVNAVEYIDDDLEVNGDISSENINNSEQVSTKNLNVTGVASTVNVNNSEKVTTKDLDATGMATTINIDNADLITTKNLKVTGKATFFELVIEKISAMGGAMMITPVEGFTIDYVKKSGNTTYLFWKSDNGAKAKRNMWKKGDFALVRNFNQAQVGTNTEVSNDYWWIEVELSSAESQSNPVIQKIGSSWIDVLDGSNTADASTHAYYHYITIDTTTIHQDGTFDPQRGQDVVMCGHARQDGETEQEARLRGNAIYIATHDSLDTGYTDDGVLHRGLTPPFLANYQAIDESVFADGVKKGKLTPFRTTFFDGIGAEFIGDFKITSGQSLQEYISEEVTEQISETDLPLYTFRQYSAVVPTSWSQTQDHDSDDMNYIGIAIVAQNIKPEDVTKYTWIAKGQSGRNITGLEEYYQWSDSGTVIPVSTWAKDRIPNHEDGKDYLWNYEKTMSDGEVVSTTTPVCIGHYGRNGEQGVGIKGITEYYRRSDVAEVTTDLITVNPDGTLNVPAVWTTEPTEIVLTNEHKYLMNCEVVQMTDDSYDIKAPHVSAVYGDTGDQGETGDDGLTIIATPYQLVFNTADNGRIPSSEGIKYTTIKVFKGAEEITEDCVFNNASNLVNCLAIESNTSEGRYGLQYRYVSLITLSDGSKVSVACGSFDVSFTYNSKTYTQTIGFIVNVARYTGELEVTNKQFRTRFTEITNGFEYDTLVEFGSQIEQDARGISLEVTEQKVGELEGDLSRTGIDIVSGKITAQTDTFEIKSNDNTKTLMKVNDFGIETNSLSLGKDSFVEEKIVVGKSFEYETCGSASVPSWYFKPGGGVYYRFDFDKQEALYPEQYKDANGEAALLPTDIKNVTYDSVIFPDYIIKGSQWYKKKSVKDGIEIGFDADTSSNPFIKMNGNVKTGIKTDGLRLIAGNRDLDTQLSSLADPYVYANDKEIAICAGWTGTYPRERLRFVSKNGKLYMAYVSPSNTTGDQLIEMSSLWQFLWNGVSGGRSQQGNFD